MIVSSGERKVGDVLVGDDVDVGEEVSEGAEAGAADDGDGGAVLGAGEEELGALAAPLVAHGGTAGWIWVSFIVLHPAEHILVHELRTRSERSFISF